MTATANEQVQNGIFFYDTPLKTDRYKFLYEHLDCDSIVEADEDADERMVSVIARAIAGEFNKRLEDLFYERGYEGRYLIIQGIDSKEVNSID